MILDDGRAFDALKRRSITIFGMSGVGKTRISAMLRHSGWFHYSVDYRIGTRYLGEDINDNLKREAMRVPFLRELLLSDSVYIGSNLSFENLAPLSRWLGKPGDPARGGIGFEDYVRRQRLHRAAEIAAMRDVPGFVSRAKELYGYDHFIADTSGSLCEVVDAADPADPVLTDIAAASMLLYIRGDASHDEALIRRFDAAPKPMYYSEGFLRAKWAEYLRETGADDETGVDPDAFIRWGFRELLRSRIPRYQAIADKWGYMVEADEIAAVRDEADFLDLVRRAVMRRKAP